MLIILEYSFVLKSIYLFMLLSLVGASLNKHNLKYKEVSLSILGGVLLSAIRFFNLNRSSAFWVEALVVVLIIYVLFSPKSLYKLTTVYLSCISFIVFKGGYSYVFKKLWFMGLDVTATTVVWYYILELVLAVIVSTIIYISFRVMHYKKFIKSFVYEIEVFGLNKELKLKMLLDSGNTLIDPKTGRPIIVCSKDALEKKLDAKINLEKLRRVNYQTINGYCSSLNVFVAPKVVLKQNGAEKEIKATIGIVDKNFKLYDGLLHILTC